MFLHTANWGLINPHIDIIIMLLIAFLLGYLLRSVFANTSTLKKRIQELENELAEANSRYGEYNSKISKLERELSAANSNVISNKSDAAKITTLENDLRLSKSKVLSLENEISKLKLANSSSAGDNSELLRANAKITQLERDLAALKLSGSSANDNDAALRAANEKIKRLESDLEECRKSKSPFVAAAAVPPPNPDDLTKIEGIGPKIQSLCNEIGIYTFQQLAKASLSDLRQMLDAEGKHFAVHDPASWPAQAQMAFEGKWEELEKWQDELKGGKL